MEQTMPWQKYGSGGPVTIGTPDPYKSQTRGLELQMKEAQLAKLKSDLAQQQASDAATIAPNTGVHGDAYLKQLPEGIANEVRAISEGRMQLPARAMTSPKFQGIMQAVVNYDPSFDAINYNARANVRKDFTSGKSSQNIKALNTAIGHVGQLYDQISGTASHGGNGNILPGATTLNAVENAYSRSRGASGITNFDQTSGAVASELTQVFRGTGGAEADIQRYLSELNPNASIDQKRGAVKNILGLLNSRLQALGDQYQKGMGTDKYPLDILDDHAKTVLTKAGVQFTDPISGNPMGGNNGGGTPPPAAPNGGGGAPPSPPGGGASPLDYMNGAPSPSLATGGQKSTLDTAANAIIDRYVRDPNASRDDLNAALRPMGYGDVPVGQWQSARQFQAQHPNYQGSYGGAVKSQPTTLFNRISAGPVGAFFTGAGDAASLGNLDSLSGNPEAFRQGMNALANANPTASTLGEMAGAIPAAAATELGSGAALGRIGAGAAARFAPLAGDLIYGAGYGAGSNDDNRLTGAMIGGAAAGAGGMFGRGLTRAAGATIRGVTSPAVQYLRNAGVPLTVGQTLSKSGWLGSAVKGVEDRLSGIPVIGDFINSRRGEGLDAFNQAAFNQGLAPIGGKVGEIGPNGVGEAQNLVGNAYDNALGGVQLQADAPFVRDMRNVLTTASELPDPMGSRAAYSLNTRVGSAFGQTGGLTGNDFQQATRGLARDARAVSSEPYGYDFGDVMGGARDALGGLVSRQAPDVLPAFDNANAAYRNLSILQDATDAAKNAEGVFTPAQLNRVSASNTRRFLGKAANARGDRPFFDLGQAGQAVLPSKVPDSGTAGRLATIALPAALGGTGAGVGYATSGSPEGGSEAALGLGALLALGGTRGGQRALTSLVLDRPNVARIIGNQIYDRAGLGGMFGAGVAAPVLLSPSGS